MRFHLLSLIAFLFSQEVISSPINDHDVEVRNLSPAECSAVVTIVDVLKLNKATPFCSSFLSISTQTKTDFTSISSTTTITTGVASTITTFVPGEPPAAKHRRTAGLELEAPKVDKRGNASPTLPPYVTAFASSALSSACSCLSLPTPTTTVVSTSTVIVTTAVTPPATTTTVYPCASPSVLYGLSSGSPNIIAGGNSLYGSGTNGTTLEGCCNLCYFDLPNCIQAYWYFYEGCVVDQASEVIGSGVNISPVCPSGVIDGLTYSPDANPPFRSTGDIAGPCGQTYNNL